MKITARIYDGKMQISEYNRKALNAFVHDPENKGTIMVIESRTPESAEMRNWFEGALVPFITYFQEGYDHRNWEDNRKVREWLKQEFNSEGIVVKGKTHIVPKTSKGELKILSEKILQWAEENGYPTKALNSDEYKTWRDTIYPYGGPENYLDYLHECGKLPKCN